MALFNKRELLASSAQTRSFSGSYETIYEAIEAKNLIKASANEFSSSKEYDIFLSHSYEDKVLINNLRKSLCQLGYAVYVDWVEDLELDREKVTKETALLLQSRMKSCKCLFYAISSNAKRSKWMPWELGYFDGLKGRVAILPIVENPEGEFTGQEYLGVYPYVDKTGKTLYIQDSATKYVRFSDWLNGKNP